eukprot:358344-Chlamydomonas_euryale.AAC.1
MQTLLRCFGGGRGSDGGGGDLTRVSAGSVDASLQSPPRLASESNYEFAEPPNPFASQHVQDAHEGCGGTATCIAPSDGGIGAVAAPAEFKKSLGSASQLQLPAVILEVSGGRKP